MTVEAIKPQRKPRASKSKTAEHFMVSIKGQPLGTKVELLKLINSSIEEDAKHLKEQLALITGLK